MDTVQSGGRVRVSTILLTTTTKSSTPDLRVVVKSNGLDCVAAFENCCQHTSYNSHSGFSECMPQQMEFYGYNVVYNISLQYMFLMGFANAF